MAAANERKPNVVFVSLSHKEYLEDIFQPLVDRIFDNTHLQRVRKAGSALRLLERNPAAVLITDEGITFEENAHVWDAVLEYVRAGGTAVLMGSFSNFTRPDELKDFFATAGLAWEAGAYHRTTFVLNREAVGGDLAAKLPASYSQKAVILKNISSEQAWYVTDTNSVTESLVFDATNMHRPSTSPVTLARIGKGKLGYIGDVNAEAESTEVVLEMCGIQQ